MASSPDSGPQGPAAVFEAERESLRIRDAVLRGGEHVDQVLVEQEVLAQTAVGRDPVRGRQAGNGHPEGRAADVIEAQAVEERDRSWISPVLATDAPKTRGVTGKDRGHP